MFLEQLVSLLMTSPKSEELNAVLLVLENLLLEVFDVLAAPVISTSLKAKTSQHLGPCPRPPFLCIERNDAPRRQAINLHVRRDFGMDLLRKEQRT